ncbi:hypothetical protein [Luteibaculum oceani]|uniref:Uncharacterized protein n=1 Tax=Luteibaculum oceani TaxID=1294296 RepID=A0A5C6V2F3_9FLAO|nr:hypothetical protein [Luteibaculum oceani]TXC78656.1 hypothetical protein FRX97_08030 [Luteibaculum oceani]
MRNLFLLGLGALALFSCEKKQNPEEFPVTFNDLNYNLTEIRKVDSIPGGFDSTYTEVAISRSKVATEVIAAFDANNQKKYDLTKSFAYNEFKRVSNVSYNGGATPENLAVSYANNGRQVSYNYQGNTEDIYDDSTIVFTLNDADVKRPSRGVVSYFWVNGKRKIAYRIQEELKFTYSGNSVAQIEVNLLGAVDSIFDQSIPDSRVNYDTTQAIIFAADTVPMKKEVYRYVSQNRKNDIQSYYPIFFNGFKHFDLSGSDYPKQIIVDYYENGSVDRTQYISFVYLTNVTTGEITQISEHRSYVSAAVNSGNLKATFYYNRP